MNTHPDVELILRMTRLVPFCKDRLFGQDEAIQIVSEAVINAELGPLRRGKPKAAFIFLGPTGVGKTELTKLLAFFLSGQSSADKVNTAVTPPSMVRFNMAEYADDAVALGRLIGSRNNEQGDLGDALDHLNKIGGGVILVDEIEKAAPKVSKIWLAGVDEAEIGFANGTRKKLESSYVIMTSNLGAREAMEMQDSGETAMKNVLREQATRFFGPEMIGRFKRFNGLVVFNPLGAEVQEQVCRSIVRREIQYFEETRGLKVVVTKEAFFKFKEEGFDKAMGARPMEGTVQRLMTTAYSKLLIDSVRNGNGSIPAEVLVDREPYFDAAHRKRFAITMKSDVNRQRHQDDIAA
jgi:ATP-dependent Clp protease ATP-binding subunit ClpA